MIINSRADHTVGAVFAPFGRGVKERNSPARGEFTPSKLSAGRRQLEAQKSFSPPADGDLRLCLKKPQTFEKV